MLGLVKTKQDAEECINACVNLHAALFSIKDSVENKIDEYFSYGKKNKILSLCRINKITMTSPEEVQHFVMYIKSEIEHLTVINMSVAFEPNEKTINMISLWFLNNINKAVLLDIVYDSKLIGGTIITYNGKYKDYSLRKKLENIDINNIHV